MDSSLYYHYYECDLLINQKKVKRFIYDFICMCLISYLNLFFVFFSGCFNKKSWVAWKPWPCIFTTDVMLLTWIHKIITIPNKLFYVILIFYIYRIVKLLHRFVFVSCYCPKFTKQWRFYIKCSMLYFHPEFTEQ